jgi:tetratricopeptide (TPR) repeat protein
VATEDNPQDRKDNFSLDFDDEGEADELTNEFEDLELDNCDDEDDIAVVSDLFQQLSQDSYSPNIADGESCLAAATAAREKPQIPPKDKYLSSPATNSRLLAWQSLAKKKREILPILAGTGILTLVVLGLLFAARRHFEPSVTLSPPPSPTTAVLTDVTVDRVNFSNLDTKQVVALAQTDLRQGDLKRATAAVEELLDRNALSETEVALAVIPQQLVDTPDISFLRGRLAWQQFSTGRKKFSLNDARRFWETAVKKQPHTPLYLNALGFVYYAEGNFDRAIALWFDALSIGEQKLAQKVDAATQRDVLNSYAGIALALSQLAAKQTGDRGQTLLQEALKLRQKVLKEAVASFQPDTLAKNWMWPKTAIRDWQAFLEIER